MGRAGRGGGGGGSRGGSFGGSRGFSSRSFGSSSHRSGYSGSSHSSSHRSSYHSPSHSYHRYNSGPRFYYFGSTRYNSGYSGGYRSDRASAAVRGVASTAIRLIVIAFILIFIFVPTGKSTGKGGSITKSTVNRDKLESKTLKETSYYIDDLGWITNSSTLEKGMKHFYEKTGVFPLLYITDDDGAGYGSLEEYANAKYDQYIKDDAHVLVLFCEKNETPQVAICVGQEASAVIDEEARQIMLDYLESYYYSDYDENTYFSKSFSESADRIMRVTPSYGWIAFIFILIIVVLIIVFMWWKKKKNQRLAEMKQAQDILNSDLHEFGETAFDTNAGQSTASPEVDPAGYASDYGSGSSTVDELKAKYDR
ncbi:MAG: hypothetical protein IKO44_04220 [Ruminococcus sp.]|nr:hypothetical protein [Ruminococcus sp.]